MVDADARLANRRELSHCVIAATLFFAFDAAFACEPSEERLPIVTEPSVRYILRDAAGESVVDVTFDPRGIRRLATADAPDFDWVLHGGDSAWHYREWQWWDGQPHGDLCRPRYHASVQFETGIAYRPDVPEALGRKSYPSRRVEATVRIDYSVDSFESVEQFLLPRVVDSSAPYIDVVYTFHNATGRAVRDYAQFFACYTSANRAQDGSNERRSHWFWDSGGELELWSDRGVDHLNGYIVHPKAYFRSTGAVPHCPRGGGKIIGAFHRPVLVSHASPSGRRAVICVDPMHAASLAQGMGGPAMDFILFPSAESATFSAGETFSSHVRHYLIQSPELPTRERLEVLWSEFMKARPSILAEAKSRRGTARPLGIDR